ncbi:DNA methyltransferase [Mycoplasma capricolum]|uniref:DNA methyltransferase n=1 Tax=Mycoplasma capricolum TaxID=2095 RepID=UPI0034DAFAE6
MKINIYEVITNLLMTNPRYVSEDKKLLKTIIFQDTINTKSELLKLLLSNEIVKKTFFENIDNILVFDKQKFARFVESKEFLEDSYTSYINKIGLTSNGEFISNSNDIVLDFPFKDCYLYGGQDKDDQKRKEIFYNELIASDDIRQMLAPKALGNAKRYTKNGVEEISEFDENDNLIIKGNNLIALASLLKRYEGKVKCIYIDPPYNTGNDSFNYNDKFNHSSWLVFMKNRLELAKKLLTDDGVIFVQCDDNEQAYLKVLMDEMFGKNNFIANIIPLMNPRGRQESNYPIAKSHEYILTFSKNEGESTFFNFGIKNNINEQDDFRLLPLRKTGNESDRKDRPNMFYPIYFNILNNIISIFRSSENDIEIWPIKSDGSEGRWRWKKENVENNKNMLICKKKTNLLYDIYVKDYLIKDGKTKGEKTKTLIIDKNIINDKAKQHMNKLFNSYNFSFPKSEFLINRIIEISTKENDIILDFFLGSGTTAAVAHKMNRRYIGIEQMNYIQDITVERLKKVIDGEQGGISKSVNWQGGGSFVYCELLVSGQQLIDEIQKADKFNILNLKNKVFSDERIIPYITSSELEQANQEFKDLSLENKKKALIKIIDKNKLYVNYYEIDDQNYKVNQNDKDFSKSFYKGE